MRTLLNNCRIVNPYGEMPFMENGSILIEDGIIKELGILDPTIQVDETVDLSGETVLPGMINAHAHLYSALAVGMPFPKGNPTNFTEVLEQVWWILDLALDKDSTRASYESGLIDHLRHGVTTVIDHHSSQSFVNGSLQLLVETAEKLGLNISGAFEMTDRNGDKIFQDSLEENLTFHRSFIQSDTVRPLIGLHASFTLSDESLQAISDALKNESHWGIHIHTAEDKADQLDAVNRGYKSTLDRLNHFGLLNKNSLVIHGIHFVEEDLKIIKDTGAMLVHNPSSNSNNRVGMTPNETIQQCISGLGTDGMQGNMLAEAKEGTLIRSGHLAGGETNVNYAELLFNNNPEIASNLFGRKIGKLDPGYAADLAIFDYTPRTDFNENNWIGHTLFGMETPSDVMTNGIFRIRNNEFIEIDEKDILSNAEKQSQQLWQKMEKIL
ncbi:MAG: amidohydrolase family protein [Candidatus Marinimicrobia bacterium]|nr:amidohydrolase family protein [Candidatus Neomarinimicrobiota bacterium]MBT7920904.1 amidohydrolase family protein [Candidatus Neomarinimicrobiota bacterium]